MQHDTAPAAPETATSLGILFRLVRDAMWARMADELVRQGHELTFSQYVTLKRLSRGVAGGSELARAADLNPGAMTRLLDRLADKGLVERRTPPGDRRSIEVELTAEGERIWREVNRCGERVRAQAMHGMSTHERAELTRLLQQVRDNLAPTGS
jgi:DNA-binding MarR family transcriptional regulator